MNTLLKLALAVLILAGNSPVSAAVPHQNCRFIQAKPDREACYKQQEEELAARRKPTAPAAETGTLESLRELRRDDEAVYRSINNICRGC